MLKCSQCNLEFANIKRINNHYKIHKEYVQKIKDAIVSLFDAGKTTIEVVLHIQKEFKCYFDSRFVMKYKNILMAKFECPICHKKLLDARYRYVHIIGAAEKDEEHKQLVEDQNKLIEKYKNNISNISKDKAFVLHIDYAIKRLQMSGQGNFKCDACGEGFQLKKSLKAHIRSKKNHRDDVHNVFFEQRKQIITNMLERGKSIEEIKSITNADLKEIHPISRLISKLKCNICGSMFQNVNGLKGHVRMAHNDYLESIEEIVLNEFLLNESIEVIIKKNNLFIGRYEVRNIWIKVFTKEQIKERGNRIISENRITGFESGKIKIWCDGQTTATNSVLAKSGYRASKTKRKINKERGIDLDRYNRHPLDTLYFNRIKRQVAKRDNHQCRKCGALEGNARMDTHHIIPHRISKCDYMSNLIYLCSRCHTKLHQNVVQLEKKEMAFGDRCDLYINGLNEFLNTPLTYDQKRYSNDPTYRQGKKDKSKKFRKDNPDYIKKYLEDPIKKEKYMNAIKRYLKRRNA